MVFSKIARIGRSLQTPLDDFQLELLQQDIDELFLMFSNGISGEYIHNSSQTSDYLTGSIEPEEEYLVGTVIGPT